MAKIHVHLPYKCAVFHRNIKDFQIRILNMTFISSSEVENVYISSVAKPRLTYTYFHFTSEIKAIFDKNV